MSFRKVVLASAIMAAELVSAHSAIIAAQGDAGGSGMALGIDTSTPRDGTRRRPFQQDATRFRGDSAETFGETIGAGDNNLEQGTSAIMAETGDSLPQITPGGEVQMTLHQVNSDGAGPYTCMISGDGTGTDWQNIQVTQNVEGNRRGRNRDGQAADHPLTAAIPANQQCSGTVAGQNNVCLVRCQNPANAGPFGGVVPVQMATANTNANGNTGNANTGNANTGNTNTGNTGNANTGNTNTGNTGNGNANTGNTGNVNSGNGNANTGNTNTGNAGGNFNNGNANTGNANTGNANNGNTGNTGNTNTGNAGGNFNNGNANTGNTGLGNTGNTGNTNTNTGNGNAGTNFNNGANNGVNTNTGNLNRREELLPFEKEEEEEQRNDTRKAYKFRA